MPESKLTNVKATTLELDERTRELLRELQVRMKKRGMREVIQALAEARATVVELLLNETEWKALMTHMERPSDTAESLVLGFLRAGGAFTPRLREVGEDTLKDL